MNGEYIKKKLEILFYFPWKSLVGNQLVWIAHIFYEQKMFEIPSYLLIIRYPSNLSIAKMENKFNLYSISMKYNEKDENAHVDLSYNFHTVQSCCRYL